MVAAGSSIISQMKEASDELTAVRARRHGAARSKRRRLNKEAAELESRITMLVTDLLETQRRERNGA